MTRRTARRSAYGAVCTKSSKFVSHPFDAPICTVVQAAVQPVVMVRSRPTGTDRDTVGLPLHDSVIVAVLRPPLNAFTLTRRRGATKRNVADRSPDLNDTLLLVNSPHGSEWYHLFDP